MAAKKNKSAEERPDEKKLKGRPSDPQKCDAQSSVHPSAQREPSGSQDAIQSASTPLDATAQGPADASTEVMNSNSASIASDSDSLEADNASPEPNSDSPEPASPSPEPDEGHFDEGHFEESPMQGKSFYVVGIGSSAGGLDALEQFFTIMQPDCGMAFVVISHLSPDHVSVMPALIGRFTRMRTFQIESGMQVEPNCVYVTPSNKDVAIMNGFFQLMDAAETRGLRQPIDYFFRSLAHDQREMAIAIVLSGSGSDGASGVREIKAELGLVMAQDPDSAKYNGMPISSISTGVVDYIMPADKMPEQLLRYKKHTLVSEPKRELFNQEEASLSSLRDILVFLRDQTGHDFSMYKKNTILRRIARRMSVHQITNMSNYTTYLRQHPQEGKIIFQELLIGVTSFFRDHEAFEALKKCFMLKLLKDKSDNHILRLWVPGCSSGEEAYSLAIIIHECMDEAKKNIPVQIFGSDIDEKAIEKARAGVYPIGILADVTSERLSRFFITWDNDTYQIKREIRDMVVFAPQNLIKDPPFIKLDLLSCRNLLIYLESEVQGKLLPLFHYALKPGGILFLGTSETIGEFTDLFSPLVKKWKIFNRRETIASTRPLIDLPPLGLGLGQRQRGTALPLKGKAEKPRKINIAQITEKMLLDLYGPPCVVINQKGDIIFIHGRTGQYLEPASGEGGLMNILKMARDGLKLELMVALRKVVTENQEIILDRVEVKSDDHTRLVRVTIKVMKNLSEVEGLMMVIFQDIAAQPEEIIEGNRKNQESFSRIEELGHELLYTKEYLQGTIEELETSNEELQSTNEELQSTNEEMQSTNEELETSQEELQSLNEEHITLNAELQGRIDELSQSDNDMKNLLESIEIATIFVDGDLRIIRFTLPVTRIINLISTDVGRPFTDIALKLKYDALVSDAQEVLRTLIPREREVQTKDGQWHMVRIRPYRTLENAISGLLLTFIDIHEQKITEEKIRRLDQEVKEAHCYAESIIDTVRQPLVILNRDLQVISCNQFFYETFHVKPDETMGRFIYDLGNRQWDIPRLKELLGEIITTSGVPFENYEVEHNFQKIGHKKMVLNARRIVSEIAGSDRILLAIEDITDRREVKDREVKDNE